MTKKRYFKCWKCNGMTITENGKKPDFMCIAPMAARTSGICGGNFSIEISKRDYNRQVIKWKKDRDKTN